MTIKNNLIILEEKRALKQGEVPHLAGNAKCLACKHEWVCVAPVGVVELECPECGTFKGVFKGLVYPKDGTLVFSCNCGCQAFTVLPGGIVCLSCGKVTSVTMMI